MLKLKYFDKEGTWSFTRPYYSKKIVELISKLPGIEKYSSVLDSTSGLGSDTIHLSQFFVSVFALELNKLRSELAVKNLEYNNITNVFLAQGDILDLPEKLHFDVIYVDCPWGQNYEREKVLKIKVSEIGLNEFIAKIIKNCRYLVMKLPKNVEKINTKNLVVKKTNFGKFDIYTITKSKDFYKIKIHN